MAPPRYRANRRVSIRTVNSAKPRALTQLTSIADIPNQTVAVNTSFSFTPTVIHPAFGAVFSMSGALPTGLAINSATGKISGTPTILGTSSSLKIRATTTLGTAESNSFSIEVYAIPSFSLISDKDGYVGVGFSLTPTVSNPSLFSLIYSVIGSLPSGLAISSSTGQISGTPTLSGLSSGLKIDATYTYGVVESNAFSLNIISATPPTGSYTNQSLGKDLSATITPTVSNPSSLTLTFSVILGTLPAGLAIDSSTGVISGTPTVAVSATITVRIGSLAGDVDLTPFAITVFELATPSHYWTFEPASISGANVSDQGTGAPGGLVTLVSDGGSTPVVAGTVGNAYHANNTVMLREAAGSQFTPNPHLTIMGAVNVPSFGSTQYLFIVHEDAFGGGNHTLIDVNIDAGGIINAVWRGADSVIFSIASGAAISTGTDHTLGLVYNNSNQRLDLYVDGVSVANTTVNVTLYAGLNGVSVGGRRDLNSNFITGSLDELAIYFVVLTPTQMAYAHARLTAGLHLT